MTLSSEAPFFLVLSFCGTWQLADGESEALGAKQLLCVLALHCVV